MTAIDARPRTEYACTTLVEEISVDDEFEPCGQRVLPAGSTLCEVWTNDNADSGYIGEEAHWQTWATDRAAFDRLVGKSRRGILHDVTVELDGERIE